MQSFYAAQFEREMGCTLADWQRWLPDASGGRPLRASNDAAEVAIDGGRLLLQWRALPPRRIALITLPRLWVRFEFVDVDSATRHAFMRRFDLNIQRGGG